MSYLDDNLPDFGTLGLPDDGLVSMPTTVPMANTPVASPASIGIGNAFSAGASLMGGIGSYMQGEETQKADDYNASLALMEGTFNVEQLGMEESSTLATQKAMYAKAGVEQSGSVLDVALSTATQYEYSKQVANFNAESAANMDTYEGKIAKSQGEMGLATGILGAVGKLL
jgi:hypothetical protein